MPVASTQDARTSLAAFVDAALPDGAPDEPVPKALIVPHAGYAYSELRRRLLDLPQVHVDDAAHAREHSLEVQLPFL